MEVFRTQGTSTTVESQQPQPYTTGVKTVSSETQIVQGRLKGQRFNCAVHINGSIYFETDTLGKKMNEVCTCLSPGAVQGSDHRDLLRTHYGSISELLSITTCPYASFEKLESEIPKSRQAHGEYRRVSCPHTKNQHMSETHIPM